MGPKVTTKSMFVILILTLSELHLAVKQISGNFMKKLIWVIKEQNMQTFILRGIFASIHVQKWTLVKHDLFWHLARDRKSPRQRRNKSFLYIFRQKLIWRELCSTNSLPSTVLNKKSIIKYSKASCGHPPYPFLPFSSPPPPLRNFHYSK